MVPPRGGGCSHRRPTTHRTMQQRPAVMALRLAGVAVALAATAAPVAVVAETTASVGAIAPCGTIPTYVPGCGRSFTLALPPVDGPATLLDGAGGHLWARDGGVDRVRAPRLHADVSVSVTRTPVTRYGLKRVGGFPASASVVRAAGNRRGPFRPSNVCVDGEEKGDPPSCGVAYDGGGGRRRGTRRRPSPTPKASAVIVRVTAAPAALAPRATTTTRPSPNRGCAATTLATAGGWPRVPSLCASAPLHFGTT